ncbi:MAG: PcfJ domain-containing protein [Nitrospirae bacterium]|nr:PcfJ domain-containing protein [Nitrospirota bacterium]
MHHCVGGYAHSIKDGHNLIFSIKDEDGRSTLQLSIVKDENGNIVRYSIAQHKGIYNAALPENHELVAQELVDYLMGYDDEPDYELLDEDLGWEEAIA